VTVTIKTLGVVCFFFHLKRHITLLETELVSQTMKIIKRKKYNLVIIFIAFGTVVAIRNYLLYSFIFGYHV